MWASIPRHARPEFTAACLGECDAYLAARETGNNRNAYNALWQLLCIPRLCLQVPATGGMKSRHLRRQIKAYLAGRPDPVSPDQRAPRPDTAERRIGSAISMVARGHPFKAMSKLLHNNDIAVLDDAKMESVRALYPEP